MGMDVQSVDMPDRQFVKDDDFALRRRAHTSRAVGARRDGGEIGKFARSALLHRVGRVHLLFVLPLPCVQNIPKKSIHASMIAKTAPDRNKSAAKRKKIAAPYRRGDARIFFFVRFCA